MTLEHVSGQALAPGRQARVAEKVEEVHALAPPLLVPDHGLLLEVAEENRPTRESPHNQPSIRCFRHHNLFFLNENMFRINIWIYVESNGLLWTKI